MRAEEEVTEAKKEEEKEKKEELKAEEACPELTLLPPLKSCHSSQGFMDEGESEICYGDTEILSSDDSTNGDNQSSSQRIIRSPLRTPRIYHDDVVSESRSSSSSGSEEDNND